MIFHIFRLDGNAINLATLQIHQQHSLAVPSLAEVEVIHRAAVPGVARDLSLAMEMTQSNVIKIALKEAVRQLMLSHAPHPAIG